MGVRVAVAARVGLQGVAARAVVEAADLEVETLEAEALMVVTKVVGMRAEAAV